MDAERLRPLSASPGLALRPWAWLLRGLQTGRLRVDGPGGRGFTATGEAAGPQAQIRLHRPLHLLNRILRRGAMGFAEGYMAGEWESEDLTALLTLAARNEAALGRASEGGRLARWREALGHRARANTRRGSRRNIAAHYDLGNDFYRLWLDPTMTYSAALFQPGEENLAAAQRRKYQRLLRQLDARPGDHILEIGCGWGGFALEAARCGYRVTGITLSREQLDWARERVAEAGLGDRVDLQLRDYRDLEGSWDHVVSIEMFEAVGEAWWPTFFETLRRCLRPGGRAALQVITIDESAFEDYRRGADFIQRYIFPGGMLPSITAFRDQTTAAGLEVRALDRFGGDYARTLQAWHHRFLDVLPQVREQGFDDRFIRRWRYYLSYCTAGFHAGRIDLIQAVLEHPDG
ncbi:class I SAM-dependent methyltransferase [Thiohalospira sp.]|uniref:class I SAM-dependent methyltransferase n=1 Tax=Thiohalospira sp. TaxID=3080549 RepID=UPI003980C4F7